MIKNDEKETITDQIKSQIIYIKIVIMETCKWFPLMKSLEQFTAPWTCGTMTIWSGILRYLDEGSTQGKRE